MSDLFLFQGLLKCMLYLLVHLLLMDLSYSVASYNLKSLVQKSSQQSRHLHTHYKYLKRISNLYNILPYMLCHLYALNLIHSFHHYLVYCNKQRMVSYQALNFHECSFLLYLHLLLSNFSIHQMVLH